MRAAPRFISLIENPLITARAPYQEGVGVVRDDAVDEREAAHGGARRLGLGVRAHAREPERLEHLAALGRPLLELRRGAAHARVHALQRAALALEHEHERDAAAHQEERAAEREEEVRVGVLARGAVELRASNDPDAQVDGERAAAQRAVRERLAARLDRVPQVRHGRRRHLLARVWMNGRSQRQF